MLPLDFRARALPFSLPFCRFSPILTPVNEFLDVGIMESWSYLLSRMNALISITEINSLYDQRPIVEKQASYAFVHPFAEALGGVVSDIPVKFFAAVVFNIIFYFLVGLVSATLGKGN